MKNRYLRLLDDIDSSPVQMPNDRILLVDGLNTFIRSFVANPATNDNGIHIGGISGFLHSIGYAIKNIKPTRIIICFDGTGGSQRRRKLYPQYKAGRKTSTKAFRPNTFSTIDDEKVSMNNQMIRLLEYLQELPVTVVSMNNIEADDTIAYITQQVYSMSQCFIMSTDKDFLQLVSSRVSVWSPTKKKFYFEQTVKEEYDIESKNFLEYRSILGDTSDNIDGVKGSGPKSLKKVIPILFESDKVDINDIILYISNSKSKSKLLETLKQSQSIIERNYNLMQLRDVDIDGHSKMSIMNIVTEPINRLNKYNVMRMLISDMLTSSIKNPDLWLNEVFVPLDAMALKHK